MSPRDDEYQMSWLEELLSPENAAGWATHRWRAFLRLIPFFFVMPLLSLALAYAFSQFLLGDDWNLAWVVVGALPGLIALLGVLVMAGQFTRAVFGLESWWASFRYAFLCMFGPPGPFPYPFAIITEGGVRERDREKALAHRQLGGPGRLVVFNDSAVVLERYGQITRIEGPGMVFLDRFERIREIIDLRPQVKTLPAEQVIVATRDGILLGTEVTIRFQIKRAPAVSSPGVPYPVAPETLMAAARAHGVRIGPGPGQRMISNWRDRVVRNMDSTLRDIVAGKTLDELFQPMDAYEDPREAIRREMLVQLSNSSAGFGAEVLDVMLGPFKPISPAVERQRLATWQATRQAEDRVKTACGEAETILTYGAAYAYAQLEMISAIDQGFRELVVGGDKLTSHFVALRFIEMLRRTAKSPDAILPEESSETLEFLNKLLTGKTEPPELFMP
jgi:hypothetical protein